jgi:flagellar biosynthesis GTPase FlhF
MSKYTALTPESRLRLMSQFLGRALVFHEQRSAQQAPSAPSTPEQPTQSISRLTPGRETPARELSDTIQPRALWTTGTGIEEMTHEDTLWVVAIHDAAVLRCALMSILAARDVAAALTELKQHWQQHWHSMDKQQNKQQNEQQNAQQNEQQNEPQNEPQNRQQNKQQNSQGQQPQQQTRQQQHQQHHMKKAADMQQHQQQWSPRQKPRQQEDMHKEYLKRFEKHVGPKQWQEIIDLSLKYEDPELTEVVQYWTIAGFKDEGAKKLVTYSLIENKQVYKNTTSTRTLGANSPRAGDDWAG